MATRLDCFIKIQKIHARTHWFFLFSFWKRIYEANTNLKNIGPWIFDQYYYYFIHNLFKNGNYQFFYLTSTVSTKLWNKITKLGFEFNKILFKFTPISLISHIPHLIPYIFLCLHIRQKWNKIDSIATKYQTEFPFKMHDQLSSICTIPKKKLKLHEMAIISPIHRFFMCKYIKCVINNRREQSKVERVIYFYAWLLTTLKLQQRKKTFSAEIGREKWFANWGPKSESWPILI